MSINDYLVSSTPELNDNMDISANYDNAELMTSDFFDSVLSLQNHFDEGFLSSFDEDNNLSSDASHTDDVLSPGSYYSESDKTSTSADNTDTECPSMVNSIDGIDDPVLLSFLDTINEEPQIKETPAPKPVPPPVVLPTSPPRKTTKILIQNPSNKKCIAKPLTNATQLKRPTKVKPQILKVQQISSNGRPVFLPLSIRSIKILNGSNNVTGLVSKKRPQHEIETLNLAPEDDDDDDDIETIQVAPGHPYPPLILTNEEKRLLSKEGIHLPSHYPLTKNEERELKRIRRKIRNKISAQDSRKRKKEYVDGLEERVKRSSEENKSLLQRLRELQKQNRTLIAHVNRLQTLICHSSTSKATPSTCLMVVLLSALLVSLPNMRLFENKQASTPEEQMSIRRSLLSDVKATEDDMNMEEFLVFKDNEQEIEGKFDDEVVHALDNSSDREYVRILDNMRKSYEEFMIDKNESDKLGIIDKVMDVMKSFMLDKKKPELFDMKAPPNLEGRYNKNGFIEPDIDDYHPGDEGPPLKRARFITDFDENIVSSTVTNQMIKDK